MPERDGYIPGVPCWVDASEPDPDAALDFYGGLLGWEFEDAMPSASDGKYFIARGDAPGSSIFDTSRNLRSGDVAAVGSITAGAPRRATWNTYFWVDSVANVASKVRDAGGRIVAEPFDFKDAARVAALTDPEGAAFRVWEAKEHRGARLVNDPGALVFNNLNTRDVDGQSRSTHRCSGGRLAPSAAGLKDGRSPATAIGSSASIIQGFANGWRTQGLRRGSRTSLGASFRSRTTSRTRRRIGA
jgi:predicted enzyme related to lactoylglutathione lyase